MEIKSTTRYVRFSPKKGRDVAREIVGLTVSDAIDTLTYTPKKAAFHLNKTLKTAVADAENNFDLDADNLVVKEATVTAGPAFRRFKPRAKGSASAIKKRTSHITVVIVEDESLPKQKRAPKSATTNNTTQVEEPVKFEASEPAPVEKSVDAAPVVDEKLGAIYKEAPAEADDLKKISGVGPVLENKLNEIGIYKFEQVENWSAEQIVEFDDLLSFKGRIERDNWLDQAKQLKEEKYGK